MHFKNRLILLTDAKTQVFRCHKQRLLWSKIAPTILPSNVLQMKKY